MVGKDHGYLTTGGEAVNPSGWSLLGQAKMTGAGQCGQQPHSLAGRGVAKGQYGRGWGSK